MEYGTVRRISLTLGLLSMTIVSYALFLNYQPKILKTLESVRGIKISNELPTPLNSQKISYQKMDGVEQITYKTAKSQHEIDNFYKIYFTDKNWELESKVEDNNSLVVKYKDVGKLATIIAEKDNGDSVVSLEIAKR